MRDVFQIKGQETQADDELLKLPWTNICTMSMAVKWATTEWQILIQFTVIM